MFYFKDKLTGIVEILKECSLNKQFYVGFTLFFAKSKMWEDFSELS